MAIVCRLFLLPFVDYFSQKSTTYPQKMPKNLSKQLQNLHQKLQISIKKGRDFSRPFAFSILFIPTQSRARARARSI